MKKCELLCRVGSRIGCHGAVAAKGTEGGGTSSVDSGGHDRSESRVIGEKTAGAARESGRGVLIQALKGTSPLG